MYDPYDVKSCLTVQYDDGDITLERPSANIKNYRGKFRYQHTVLDGETIMGIANQYYGDSGYWVLIADINSIYEPLNDLVPGMILLIP